MQLIKKGRIYKPEGKHIWDKKYGLMPTPIWIKEDHIIRVFYSSTDNHNDGRISFIDLDEDDPSKIIYEHSDVVLDIGSPGLFDDSGVAPSCIIKDKDRYFLFYVGFQRCEKVPYMLFSGLAMSDDCKKFHKASNAPIIERTADNYLSNAAAFVIPENGIFRMWHWVGYEWITIHDKLYIRAGIALSESKDLHSWKLTNTTCLVPDANREEFSLGRPWIIKTTNQYHMWYSVRYEKKMYRIGYAESLDGVNWQRRDEKAGIDVSATGWDSEMVCYPAFINVKDKWYLFYNGNNNGESGFGYAELTLD